MRGNLNRFIASSISFKKFHTKTRIQRRYIIRSNTFLSEDYFIPIKINCQNSDYSKNWRKCFVHKCLSTIEDLSYYESSKNKHFLISELSYKSSSILQRMWNNFSEFYVPGFFQIIDCLSSQFNETWKLIKLFNWSYETQKLQSVKGNIPECSI